MNVPGTVAVVGASGFIGRALVHALLDAGYDVRRLARRPAALSPLTGVTDERFDLDDETPNAAALAGVDAAFYLVHAMASGKGFAQRDAVYAHRFAAAARSAGVPNVVYLGGLYPRDTELSPHLASRREVGDILRRECGALHIRAGVIIARESASFEIMRDLVRRLPMMVTPRWVDNDCQATALSDVVAALVGALGVEGDREVDLGGGDVLTYRDMLRRTARAMGLRRRLIVGVPVLSPGLSARWLRFITSVPLPIARALVESLRHAAVADGADFFAELGITPMGFDDAVRRAQPPRPRVVGSRAELHWGRGGYTLVQRFRLSRDINCDRALFAGIDAELRGLTERAALRLLRWHGNELRLLRFTLLRLGVPVWDAKTWTRSIDGGSLVKRGGGTISLTCHSGMGTSIVEAALTGYTPRLPGMLYRFQAGLHQRLMRAAVRTTLANPAG